ncbi:MAG: type IV pilus assembly protein FimV, partial [Steroidobacteraceae bacterium]
MVAKRSSRAVALLLVVPSAAFALGLGDIRLLSPLDQPLKAQIELLDATPNALQNLQVHLASQDVFARYGLSWPQFLSNVHVKAVRAANGKEVVELTSDQPITDPVLTLLVEANWDRGHLIREYTVLLDPPVYVPTPSQTASEQVAPAATGTAQRGGAIARLQTPAPEAAAPAAAASGGEPHSLVVRRGQTLSGIANKLSGAGLASGPTRSWMVAIYQANPEAFDRNMNLLRSGSVLRIPDSTAVAAVSSTAAATEIRRQYAAWRGESHSAARAASGPGRLRLVAPSGEGAAGSGTTGSSPGQVKALQAQVQTLQTQLDDEHRLLQLKDEQLARIQAQLAGKPASQATPAAAPSHPAAALAPSATSAATAAAPGEAAPAPQAAPPAAVESAPAVQHAPKPAPHVAHRPAVSVAGAKPSSSPSIFETIASYWWAVALLIVAVLAAIGARIRRSRRQSDLDDSLGRLAAAGATPSPYTRLEPSTGDTASMRPIAAEHDDAFIVEETGTHERPKLAAAAAPVTAKHITTADQTISSETAINLDQGDPLAEADFHMAYGLY